MSYGDLRLPLGVCVKVEDRRGIVITWKTGMDELQGEGTDRLYLFLMYDDETFRFSLFDRLPDCRGDGGAIVELPLQEQNPAYLFYFFGSVDCTHFSDSGYFRLT